MKEVLTHAQRLVQRGIPVFPCDQNKQPLVPHGFKDASKDKDTIIGWWKKWPDALLAVPTGSVSGLLVVDIDPDGAEWYAEHALELKAGRVHKTPRGHHLLYKMPDEDIRCSASKLAPGVDIRANGGYVIWWPAHSHEPVGDLDDINGAAPLPISPPKISSRSRISRGGNGGKVQEGQRNDHLARMAGALRGQGVGSDAIAVALKYENAERCDPPLDEREVAAIAASISRYASPVIDSEDEEPEPLRRFVGPAPVYPIDNLGEVLAPAAKRISEVVQAPEALCGQSVLAAASLAAQAHADVVIDGRREPLSLWCISIAESGERKSSADNNALEPHRTHERLASDQYRRDLAEFKDKLSVFDTQRRATLRQEDKAEIEAGLKKLGDPPTPPLKPMMMVSAPTLEGLHKLYREGQPSLGLFHDDGGEFIGGHSMGADHRMKSASGLSKLWDCGEFDRIRSQDGAEKFYGRRLALHLMIQPVVAEHVLGDALLLGQGFLARCLLAWPESRIGQRPYVAVDLSTDPALAKYGKAISDLLKLDPPVRPEAPQELAPRSLHLTSDAKQRWIELHDSIEESQAPGGELYAIRPWGSKAAAQILRVAGVLTLITDPGASVIHIDAIERGSQLVLYALEEAVRVVGYAQVPEEIQNAEALLEWCREQKMDLLYSGKALQLGPYAIRSKDAFDAAIRQLEKAGWAAPVPGGAKIDDKHRRRVWRIWK